MLKTIGVEEEFLLVTNKQEQGHVDNDMLADILAEGSGVSPEIFDSHLEVQTPPCSKFSVLRDEILYGRRRAQTIASKHGHDICAAGTLACYDWREVKALPHPRVQSIVADFSDTFRSQSIAALHVHTKMSTLAASLAMVNALSAHVWLFLALSGSSRYYDRRDTGLSSRRVSLIGQTPRTGFAPFYHSVEDYEGEQRALALGGWEKNKLWYYLRHNPHHDTVELRIMDSIPRVDDVLAVSALFLCLCKAYEDGLLKPTPMDETTHRILAQINLERAICSGSREISESGKRTLFFMSPDKELPLFALVETLVQTLAPVAKELGCHNELMDVVRIAFDGNSSARQHEAVTEYGSLAASVHQVRSETLYYI